MSLTRKISLIFAFILLFVSFSIVAYDFSFIGKYDLDALDVAAVADDGVVVEWPTGERPSWANFPLIVYSLPFFAVASLIVIYHPGKKYHGRIHLGTE